VSKNLLVLLILACAIARPVWSQTFAASLEGGVRDATGGAIPRARVRIVNTATNAHFALTTTEADGRFLAPSLPPGPYSVTVEADGFKKVVRTGIVLQVNQAARIEIVMEVGAVTETVEVSAQALLLEASNAVLGQVVNNTNIVNLPLNQRNPYSLVLLVPGVRGSVGAGHLGVGFQVNGGRAGTSEVLLDGIPSSPPDVNGTMAFTMFPSVDAVQEFKVDTNNYSAEYGRSGGAVVNLIYKSGTNALHGSLFEFLRNSDFDSNDFFANSRGIPLLSFKRNQFGVSAGGPVYLPSLYDGRNRTFFFGDFEGLRQRAAANLLTTVPTALQRAGDFSQTRNAAGAPIINYDPVTTTPTGSGFVRTPFADNRIPASRIDPVAERVAKYYPLPNGPGDPNSGSNNFAAAGATLTDINQADVKLDHILGDKSRSFVRVSRRNVTVLPANFFPADVLIAQGGMSQPEYATSAVFSHTYNFRPTFLVEFRYGFGRVLLAYRPRSEAEYPGNQTGFDPTQLGLPTYIRDNADRPMFPGFAVQGYVALGNGGAQFRRNAFYTHAWQLNNTKVQSRHLLKFGFEARLIRVQNTEAGQADGMFTFTPSFTQGPDPNRASATTGNGLASFLLGLGSGALTKSWQGSSTQSPYYGGYFSDDWKVSSRLTLNLGLRYELDVPRTERFNRMNYFDPSVPSPLARPAGLPDLKGGLVFVGINGQSRSQFSADKKSFAPRFGFAYHAGRRTVLRGAYGIFYDASPKQAVGDAGHFGFRSDSAYVGTLDGVTPLNYLRNPFPNGITPIPGSSQGLMTSVGSSFRTPVPGTVLQPYSQNWNFGVQRELPGSILVDATYVGARGLHLTQSSYGNYNLNQLRPQTLALGAQLQQLVPNPFFGLIRIDPLASQNIPRSYLLADYPQFTQVLAQFMTGASSIYNSFQLKSEKRFRNGLGFLLAYTAGKLIGDAGSNNSVGRMVQPQDVHNRRADRGVSPEDVSQRFVLSYVFELPVGRGRKFGKQWNWAVDAFLGGWQLNGITTFETGQPLLLTTQDTSLSGGAVLRPNNNGESANLGGEISQRLGRYLDTSVFSRPAPFTFGNVGSTLPDVRGPGGRNFDFSLFKSFGIGERTRLEFRAESFNLSNTPRFGLPDQNLSSVTFGRITTQSNAPRQVQFGLKLLF